MSNQGASETPSVTFILPLSYSKNKILFDDGKEVCTLRRNGCLSYGWLQQVFGLSVSDAKYEIPAKLVYDWAGGNNIVL